jgi:alcohol dehydrogenase (cytochrome c)
LTGKEAWRFYTTPAPGEPGDESWGGAALDKRMASTWGLPGTYDPVRKLVYWGVANPMPDQRSARHDGNPDAVSRSAPADLYSNSTVALDPATGKLSWYYQHLPADDWDSDYTHERELCCARA